MRLKLDERSHYRTFHHIFMYITERCQLRCNHCYMGSRLDKATEMSYETVIRNMTYCRNLGAENITFLGGEPTLHTELPLIIDNAIKIGFTKIYIDTNGLDIQRIKIIAPDKITYIRVSLDGASEKTHDQFRGEGTFRKTIKSIKELIAAGYRVAITTTVSQCNINEALNILPLAERLGISLINFHVFSEEGQGIANPHWSLDPQDWIQFYESIENIKDNHRVSIWYPPTWTTLQKLNRYVDEGYRGCLGCTLDRLSIFPSGECHVCSVLLDKPFYFGKITDEGFILNKNQNEFEIFTKSVFQASKPWLSGCPADKYLEEQGKKKMPSKLISVCRCWKRQI